jgi:hypothetical protein
MAIHVLCRRLVESSKLPTILKELNNQDCNVKLLGTYNQN